MNVNNVVLKESELIRRYVDERQIPGACFSIVTPKEIAYSSYGNKALVPEEEATSTDTLYDIASLSKVVSTSTMIAKLIEEGRLSFDTKVSSVLTDFPHEDITLKDLLVHTSGYPADDKDYKKCKGPKELYDFILHLPRTYKRGEKVEYSCFNYLLLGRIIDKLCGDMEDYAPAWVEPMKVNYRGTDVWEMPPNGDGLVVLAALAVLNNIELDNEHPDSEENFHKIIEAMKLGYEDGLKYISDPRTMRIPPESIIAPEYAKKRAALIGEEAILPAPGDPLAGATIYLCTADAEGNMVSLIQSNFNGFGSGIVVPGTGISLQNRGFGFSLDPESPNVLAPKKKSFHTIIPGFLSKDGEAIGPFGVMGAFMQPQGQLQVASNLIDFGMNPQEALDRPRWEWIRGKKIVLEESFPEEIAEALRARGHEVGREPDTSIFGRGQIILRDENGVLVGATEPRADGTVAVW